MGTTTLKRGLSPDTVSHNAPCKDLVRKTYHELLARQESLPDKSFISGYTIRELDQNLVVLEDTIEHPRSWSTGRKARSTAIIGGMCFISPFASTIFAPSVHLVMSELHISNNTIGALLVSIFMFAYAIGPLFLAPLSERFGRAIVVHGGNVIFVAFSIGGGFSQTVTTQFLFCRYLAGIGASASVAVLGGFVADIYNLESRAKASGVVMIGPIIGPIIGPVCGGWMSEASWRWTLWVPAIASGILSLVGFFLMPETYAPCILQRKLKAARKSQSNDQLYSVLDLDDHATGLWATFSEYLRPVVYLAVDPALLLASIFVSVIYGTLYLLVVTFSDVFGVGYGHSVGIVGTDMLSWGVGSVIGTIGTIRVMDAVFKRDETTKEPKYKPESRLISCVVGTIITAGGLFIYGFSALKTHFMVPLIGCAIFAMGTINIVLAIQLYAVDGFKFSASAFASISVLRFLFAGAFPLFGPKLFEKLGADWGVALLAFLVLGLGLPLLLLLYLMGPKLRKLGVERMDKFVGSAKK